MMINIMRNIRLFSLFFIFCMQSVHAAIVIDINKGLLEPLPVAVSDFLGNASLGHEIAEIVAANLKRSGLFFPLDRASFSKKILKNDGIPNFQDWKTINAQVLVTGSVNKEPDGRIKAQFRLWDILAGEQMVGKKFVASYANKRRLAHIISDTIYERLTGEKGYFDTRIVFISETGVKTNRKKRLAIIDQDGAGLRYLSDNDSIILTPRFSPNSQEITYMSYKNGKPQVYLLQTETGEHELVGNFPGMTFAPRFSPDGRKIIMSLLRSDGNSNIFTMNLGSRITTRLTNVNAIDTSPCYSPDEKYIVFTSDRGGRAQIYVMSSDGSGQNRISFGGGTYSTPVWSPRGDWIAFTKQVEGKFQIGVMKPDGSSEKILSSGFAQEGPTWAPNGRIVMFFTQEAGEDGPKLKSVDLSGRVVHAISTPHFASDPAWSGLLD